MPDSESAERDYPNLGMRIASLRKARGLTLAELGGGAGISTSMVSQIERGQAQPSVRTLYALAAALGTSAQALFLRPADPSELSPGPDEASGELSPGRDEASGGATPTSSLGGASRAAEALANWDTWDGRSPIGPVVRRGTGRFAEIAGGVTWYRLTPYDLGNTVIMATIYEPGSSGAEELYRHEGHETHIVTEGRVVVELVFDRYELRPGDSITFDSSQPHRYSNPFDEVARGVTVVTGDAGAGDLDGTPER